MKSWLVNDSALIMAFGFNPPYERRRLANTLMAQVQALEMKLELPEDLDLCKMAEDATDCSCLIGLQMPEQNLLTELPAGDTSCNNLTKLQKGDCQTAWFHFGCHNHIKMRHVGEFGGA